MGAHESTYVTFNLGKDTYGIDVTYVQEVTSLADITAVPNSLDFMKGVIDLRGIIVPLVDLRLRFGMPPVGYNGDTAVLVTEIDKRKNGVGRRQGH